jgi:hypothetical protein
MVANPAAGWRAAHSNAASRFGTSIMPKPASNSFVSAYGPSWTCRFPSRTVTVVAFLGESNLALGDKDAGRLQCLGVSAAGRQCGFVIAVIEVFL